MITLAICVDLECIVRNTFNTFSTFSNYSRGGGGGGIQ